MFYQLQAHSTWLYIVPWGMYKAVTYVKERYGNPVVILSENGTEDSFPLPTQQLSLRHLIHDR